MALASHAANAGGPALGRMDYQQDIRPFLQQHCTKCHGEKKQKGDLRLDGLDGSHMAGGDLAKWQAVYEKMVLGEMPPEEEARPESGAQKRMLDWLSGELRKAGKFDDAAVARLKLPQHGNRVDHDTLFSGQIKTAPASQPRMWRMSPFLYSSFLRNVSGAKSQDKASKLAQAFTLASSEGFKDYATLFVVDEPTLGQLIRNAQQTGAMQTGAKRTKEFAPLIEAGHVPTDAEIAAAVRRQFQMALLRAPTEEESDRFLAFARKNMRDAGQEAGAKNMLATILMLPEALYRFELGAGPVDAHGRQRLAPREIAYALAFALTDEPPDAQLLKAAESGQLVTTAGVRDEINRILGEPRIAKPRVMRFFDEYFEYTAAMNVFKDVAAGQWRPELLIADTQRLIQWILDEDKDVLRQLLTTPKSFVNYKVDPKAGPVPAREVKEGQPKRDKKTGEVIPVPPRDPLRKLETHDHYNLPLDWKWDAHQPVTFSAKERAGILTQPSWLAAFATNDENHAIRRGKWIRERLLGNVIHDLPITVDAQLPQAPGKTLRERMEVTKKEYCWQCHQKMNPIGLTFEAYDFLGRRRATEPVRDIEATAANVDKKGNPLGPVLRQAPMDTSGAIANSGDPKLDGPVRDAIDLIHKLADSPRVRQVFVRHAFRYWMGRNETLSDSATLIAADRAYVGSGGSFKALVASLLTSDSFLYRYATPDTKTASSR